MSIAFVVLIGVLAHLNPTYTQSVTHSLYFNGYPSMKHQRHSQHALKLATHKRHTLQSLNLKHQSQRLVSTLSTDGFSFRMPITVGGVEYNVNLDTGSSDFMIKGETTEGSPNDKYNCDDQNCHKDNQHISIGYLDGFLNCYSTHDTVSFAGQAFTAQFLVAYKAQSKFDTIQGICGVSFPEIAVNEPNLIQTMMKQKMIDRYAYGVNFNFLNTSRSHVTFGESDPEFYEGKLDMYKLDQGYSITTTFKWIKFGEGGKRLPIDEAVFDTGTTCISIPNRYSDQIIAAFQNNKTINRCYFYNETLPTFQLLICRVMDFQQLPVLQIVVDKIIYKITKQNYIQYCLEHNKIQYCVTYIQRYTSRDTILLGDGFFRRYYGYFDLENREIGLAPNKQVTTIEDILNQPPQDEYLEQDWAPVNY